MLADFPPHIQKQVQAILDRQARRLLAESIEAAKAAEQPQEAISDDGQRSA
jgi:hypothetical protein